jgi:hypothetical protein
MPKYFFYYIDAAGGVRDRDSLELASDGEAQQQAESAARNLLNSVTSSLAANWRGWTIVVKNESDRNICSYPIQKTNSLV